jgi:cytochrome b6
MRLSSPGAPKSGLAAWLDERLGLSEVVAFLRHKTVPLEGHTLWYYFGGVALFLFGLQVATGLLLLFYYKPGIESSYESVQFIVTRVPFGWLIRSLHSWSANLMVFAVFVHMFSVYFLKAYRPPRELTWLTGMALLGLTMTFGFSGYLLPWNQLAFFATKVGTDIAGVLPVVGPTMARLLRGGEEISGTTLTRFFGFHVAMLPAAFTAVLLVHLLLIQRQGMSETITPPKHGERRGMPFYPGFIMRDAILWLGVLAVLLVLWAQGRPLRVGAGGNSAGVVLHLRFPEPQVSAGQDSGIRRRCGRDLYVPRRCGIPLSGAISRSQRGARTSEPAVHLDRRGHPRVHAEYDHAGVRQAVLRAGDGRAPQDTSEPLPAHPERSRVGCERRWGGGASRHVHRVP